VFNGRAGLGPSWAVLSVRGADGDLALARVRHCCSQGLGEERWHDYEGRQDDRPTHR